MELILLYITKNNGNLPYNFSDLLTVQNSQKIVNIKIYFLRNILQLQGSCETLFKNELYGTNHELYDIHM